MHIPEAKRDGSLINRLLIVILVGFDNVMEKESQLYLRQLARLVDKAFTEYSIVRECVLEEIKTKDRLMYRIEIINHLENCISAISGVSKILYRLQHGLVTNAKRVKKNLLIYSYISDQMKKKVLEDKIWNVRNTIEHIDKEIYLGKFQDQLFLDISKDYKYIGINGKRISLQELTSIITTYHEMTLEIFNRLPTSETNGIYYYDRPSE